MTDLSPAARAVMDAWWNDSKGNRSGIAAALRAAADRTECLISDTPHPKFAEGVLDARDLLESIAAELEGSHD